MKKLAFIIATLALVQVSTFAAININLDSKRNKIEVTSDNSAITDIRLERVDGGIYSSHLISPSNIVNISTDKLLSGVYLVKVNSLNGEREAEFLNIQ